MGYTGGNRALPPSTPLEPGRAIPEPATGCNEPSDQPGARPDECACGMLACEPGQTCVKTVQPPPVALGGPGSLFNGCFELCSEDADCSDGRSCALNGYGFRECAALACRRDADCDEQPCGVCMTGLTSVHGGSPVPNEVGNHCMYE